MESIVSRTFVVLTCKLKCIFWIYVDASVERLIVQNVVQELKMEQMWVVLIKLFVLATCSIYPFDLQMTSASKSICHRITQMHLYIFVNFR